MSTTSTFKKWMEILFQSFQTIQSYNQPHPILIHSKDILFNEEEYKRRVSSYESLCSLYIEQTSKLENSNVEINQNSLMTEDFLSIYKEKPSMTTILLDVIQYDLNYVNASVELRNILWKLLTWFVNIKDPIDNTNYLITSYQHSDQIQYTITYSMKELSNIHSLSNQTMLNMMRSILKMNDILLPRFKNIYDSMIESYLSMIGNCILWILLSSETLMVGTVVDINNQNTETSSFNRNQRFSISIKESNTIIEKNRLLRLCLNSVVLLSSVTPDLCNAMALILLYSIAYIDSNILFLKCEDSLHIVLEVLHIFEIHVSSTLIHQFVLPIFRPYIPIMLQILLRLSKLDIKSFSAAKKCNQNQSPSPSINNDSQQVVPSIEYKYVLLSELDDMITGLWCWLLTLSFGLLDNNNSIECGDKRNSRNNDSMNNNKKNSSSSSNSKGTTSPTGFDDNHSRFEDSSHHLRSIIDSISNQVKSNRNISIHSTFDMNDNDNNKIGIGLSDSKTDRMKELLRLLLQTPNHRDETSGLFSTILQSLQRKSSLTSSNVVNMNESNNKRIEDRYDEMIGRIRVQNVGKCYRHFAMCLVTYKSWLKLKSVVLLLYRCMDIHTTSLYQTVDRNELSTNSMDSYIELGENEKYVNDKIRILFENMSSKTRDDCYETGCESLLILCKHVSRPNLSSFFSTSLPSRQGSVSNDITIQSLIHRLLSLSKDFIIKNKTKNLNQGIEDLLHPTSCRNIGVKCVIALTDAIQLLNDTVSEPSVTTLLKNGIFAYKEPNVHQPLLTCSHPNSTPVSIDSEETAIDSICILLELISSAILSLKSHRNDSISNPCSRKNGDNHSNITRLLSQLIRCWQVVIYSIAKAIIASQHSIIKNNSNSYGGSDNNSKLNMGYSQSQAFSQSKVRHIQSQNSNQMNANINSDAVIYTFDGSDDEIGYEVIGDRSDKIETICQRIYSIALHLWHSFFLSVEYDMDADITSTTTTTRFVPGNRDGIEYESHHRNNLEFKNSMSENRELFVESLWYLCHRLSGFNYTIPLLQSIHQTCGHNVKSNDHVLDKPMTTNESNENIKLSIYDKIFPFRFVLEELQLEDSIISMLLLLSITHTIIFDKTKQIEQDHHDKSVMATELVVTNSNDANNTSAGIVILCKAMVRSMKSIIESACLPITLSAMYKLTLILPNLSAIRSMSDRVDRSSMLSENQNQKNTKINIDIQDYSTTSRTLFLNTAEEVVTDRSMENNSVIHQKSIDFSRRMCEHHYNDINLCKLIYNLIRSAIGHISRLEPPSTSDSDLSLSQDLLQNTIYGIDLLVKIPMLFVAQGRIQSVHNFFPTKHVIHNHIRVSNYKCDMLQETMKKDENGNEDEDEDEDTNNLVYSLTEWKQLLYTLINLRKRFSLNNLLNASHSNSDIKVSWLKLDHYHYVHNISILPNNLSIDNIKFLPIVLELIDSIWKTSQGKDEFGIDMLVLLFHLVICYLSPISTTIFPMSNEQSSRSNLESIDIDLYDKIVSMLLDRILFDERVFYSSSNTSKQEDIYLKIHMTVSHSIDCPPSHYHSIYDILASYVQPTNTSNSNNQENRSNDRIVLEWNAMNMIEVILKLLLSITQNSYILSFKQTVENTENKEQSKKLYKIRLWYQNIVIRSVSYVLPRESMEDNDQEEKKEERSRLWYEYKNNLQNTIIRSLEQVLFQLNNLFSSINSDSRSSVDIIEYTEEIEEATLFLSQTLNSIHDLINKESIIGISRNAKSNLDSNYNNSNRYINNQNIKKRSIQSISNYNYRNDIENNDSNLNLSILSKDGKDITEVMEAISPVISIYENTVDTDDKGIQSPISPPINYYTQNNNSNNSNNFDDPIDSKRRRRRQLMSNQDNYDQSIQQQPLPHSNMNSNSNDSNKVTTTDHENPILSSFTMSISQSGMNLLQPISVTTDFYETTSNKEYMYGYNHSNNGVIIQSTDINSAVHSSSTLNAITNTIIDTEKSINAGITNRPSQSNDTGIHRMQTIVAKSSSKSEILRYVHYCIDEANRTLSKKWPKTSANDNNCSNNSPSQSMEENSISNSNNSNNNNNVIVGLTTEEEALAIKALSASHQLAQQLLTLHSVKYNL